MQLPENIFLVRHGDYNFPNKPEHLNDLGRKQAISAGMSLQEEGFDGTSIILASTAPRCVETAEIIYQTLKLETEIVHSRKLEAMDEGQCLGDVRGVLAEIALESEVDINPDSSLAVVGHAPMIYKVLDVDLSQLGCGSVHKMAT